MRNPYRQGRSDDLRSFRGILNALGLSLLIWALALGAFYLFVP